MSLSLYGTEMPPEEISRATGIQATTCLARGERNAGLMLPRQNVWSLVSRVDSNDVSAHWQDIESVLLPNQDLLKEIAASGRPVITIAIRDAATRFPSLMIPPSLSSFAGHIGAVIDVDHIQ
jgi:hypothetical protein